MLQYATRSAVDKLSLSNFMVEVYNGTKNKNHVKKVDPSRILK